RLPMHSVRSTCPPPRDLHTLPLHDALPILSILISASSLPNTSRASTRASSVLPTPVGPRNTKEPIGRVLLATPLRERRIARDTLDRKSTRLNSSHVKISYAVFCLKKKKIAE